MESKIQKFLQSKYEYIKIVNFYQRVILSLLNEMNRDEFVQEYIQILLLIRGITSFVCKITFQTTASRQHHSIATATRTCIKEKARKRFTCFFQMPWSDALSFVSLFSWVWQNSSNSLNKQTAYTHDTVHKVERHSTTNNKNMELYWNNLTFTYESWNNIYTCKLNRKTEKPFEDKYVFPKKLCYIIHLSCLTPWKHFVNYKRNSL